MQVWRYCAFPVLLLTQQYFGASRAAGVVAGGATARYPDAGEADTSGAAGVAMSGIVEDNDLTRYADDIYSQSGGVRVRDIQLTPDGLAIYKQFVAQERRAQRAFIWERLKLGNINFVHSSDTSWVTQKREPTLISRAVADPHVRIPILKASSIAERRSWFRELLHNFPPQAYPDLSLEHVGNVEWNANHLSIFRDSIVNQPRYNDKPGAANAHQGDPHTDDAYRYAYNEPRFRECDAVVNYRVNWRDLVKERLMFLDVTGDLVGREVGSLNRAIKRLATLGEDDYFQFSLLERELERRTADTIDIDVNVDAVARAHADGGPEKDLYAIISEAIEAQMESVYQQRTALSASDATAVLQEIAQQETVKGNRYKNFNEPDSGAQLLSQLHLESTDRLRDNIDAVYRRATIRREEFHKMTEPVVVNTRGALTYRVHFTDPERRYVEADTKIVRGEKSKQWYRALWKRLLEPIFQDAVIEELRETTLRDIVLVYADDLRQMRVLAAYVANSGEHLVIHCASVDGNAAITDYVLRHEYGHVVDYSTEHRTIRLFQNTEHEDDLASLTSETIERKIKEIGAAEKDFDKAKGDEAVADVYGYNMRRVRAAVAKAEKRFNALEARRDHWEEAQRERAATRRPFTFNADQCHGFPSCYGQTDMWEAAAELRYGMRNEAIRSAFLRRMALDRPTAADARRLKQLYDIARDEMKDLAPHLHQQWGELYDGVEQASWGLRPGHVAHEATHHHQIITLDNTLATNMASGKLATHLLQRGYDVATMAHTIRRAYDPATQTSEYVPLRVCSLQSNLQDPRPGAPHLESTLHLIGGSQLRGRDVAARVYAYFVEFTPTGRVNTANKYNPNFVEVSFVRSPFDRFRPAAATHAEFLADFREQLSLLQGAEVTIKKMPQKMSILEDEVVTWPRDAHKLQSILEDEMRQVHGVDMWPRDANLYREKMFAGWLVNGEEIWDPIDIAEQITCKPI